MEDKKVMLNDEELDNVSGGSILPYIVKAGDTYESIAGFYKISAQQLKKMNNKADNAVLQAGEVLNIMF